VHESLLKKSPFFAVLLANANADPLILPKSFKLSPFNIYVHWLYTGLLHTSDASENTSIEQHRNDWIKLMEVYLLGDILKDFELRDTVMDSMLDWFQKAPPAARSVVLDNLDEVYDHLEDKIPLRMLVSDIAAWHLVPKDIEELRTKSFHPDVANTFLFDTLIKTSKKYEKGVFGSQPSVIQGQGNCKYHCHGDKTCYQEAWL
jgi:hypothetical protein